jgi:pentatricopeptide repeat protein
MKPDGVPTALALFEEIKARSDVAPDEYTYGTLLAACAQAGDAKTAQALVVEMEEAGVPHNQVNPEP